MFPKNFLWGAATSAHQVEGNLHNDWTEWEKLGRVHGGERSGRASGHAERYAADFAMAKELGHTAHRFSLEWSRIEPKPGKFDLDAIAHYRKVLEELRRLGLEPIVTLHHFTNPLWLRDMGGWAHAHVIDRFGKYVATVMQELGHLATYWVTINEPTIYSTLSYLSGYWPPERKNVFDAWTVIRRMVAAHRLAYHIIHRHSPHAKVGVANNLSDFAPVRKRSTIDRSLVRFASYWHNQWWLDQTYQTQDFIGLNYYFYHPIKFGWSEWRSWFAPHPHHDKPVSDVGWAIHPEGMLNLLRWLRRYNRPIIITENGIADREDKVRAGFIRGHLDSLAAALRDGVDVRGYLHWSLLDNFEWREGFGPRFGLIEVEYATLQRRIRPSAYAYRDLIRTASAT